jgi:hypothetical protein
VIAKVLRGWRPGGLVAYLFGPGKFEQHRSPRVVASWDGAPWLHQPDKLPAVLLGGERLEPGEFDFELRQLIATMTDPAHLAGLPTTNPPAITAHWAGVLRAGGRLPAEAPGWLRYYRYDPNKDVVALRPGYVWHCPVRLHPDDPTLTDAQWQHIAQRLMAATGIHQAECRWIAIRHAEDHIHLMATLVNEQTGKRFHPYQDYPKLRAECQRLEREFGLVATAGIDQTAARAPTRAEHGKAQRTRRATTAREELRRVVSQCAATTHDGDQFLAALQREGLDPVSVYAETGQVRGYTVALPGDYNAAGEQVRFAGSSLAPDLSWPKLTARWATTPPASEPVPRTKDGQVPVTARRAALQDAATAVERAAAVVRTSGQDVEGIAHATGELLMALGRGREGRDPGPITQLAQRFDRAARTPWQVVPSQAGAIARELRLASRRIGAVGALSGRGNERLAGLALLLALAGLIAEIAAWQHLQGRPHQASAAHATAMALPALARTAVPGRPTPPPGAAAPAPASDTPEHGLGVADRPPSPIRPAPLPQPRPRHGRKRR